MTKSAWGGGTATRDVLKFYSYAFLDKNMYVCMGLAIVFYSLWTMNQPSGWMKWTVPIFILVMMKYSLDVENGTEGDPIEVVTRDKLLMLLLVFYAVSVFAMLYLIN